MNNKLSWNLLPLKSLPANFKKQLFLDDSFATINYEINHSKTIIKITGRVNSSEFQENQILIIWAPNPTETRQSFTGSGMPYISRQIAYENTPNRAVFHHNKMVNQEFEVVFLYPSGYYSQLGSIYNPPEICLQVYTPETKQYGKIHKIVLDKLDIPYRTLISPPERTGPSFYHNRFQNNYKNAESLFYKTVYHVENTSFENFWKK